MNYRVSRKNCDNFGRSYGGAVTSTVTFLTQLHWQERRKHLKLGGHDTSRVLFALRKEGIL